MKKLTVVLLTFLLPLPVFAQEFDYISESIEIYNKAKDIHDPYSCTMNENGECEIVKITYDSDLDKIALEKAELLAKKQLDKISKEMLFNNDLNYNYNYISIEFPTENREEWFPENDNYFIYANSFDWSRIDIGYVSDFYEDNDNIIEERDRDELLNVIRSRRVGFAVTKSDTHVYVVACFQ